MLRLRQLQIRRQQHPPQPGQGIAPGPGGLQQAVHVRGLPHRPVKPAVQPLAAAVIGEKVLLGHGPQPGQNGPLAGVHIHRPPACGDFPPQHLRRFPGQEGHGLLRVPRPQKPPDVGGGGDPIRRAAVVGSAPARERYRFHGKIRPAQGLQILDGQDVVGLGQQRRVPGVQQLLHRRLAAAGKGLAALQSPPEGLLKALGGEAGFHPLQGLQVAALAAEGQVGHQAGFLQQLHAAPGKALRSGHRPRRGQLQYQVRPVPDGHLRPGKLVHGGKFPPLGEAATHGTHHRSLPVQLLQHPPVPQMEGVIFADHAENGHAITPFQEITNSYKLVTN